MSAYGTSRTCRDAVWRSAFRGKADYKVTSPKRLLMTDAVEKPGGGQAVGNN